jgi:hypothetical protein
VGVRSQGCLTDWGQGDLQVLALQEPLVLRGQEQVQLLLTWALQQALGAVKVACREAGP